MNLIKLEDLNVVPLEEIRKELDTKYSKMVFDDEINEIEEELNIDENEMNLVNNVVLKAKEFGEPSEKNTYFMRPRYIPAECTTNFSFMFIPRKTTTFEDIGLALISKIGYNLNIDGAHNGQKNI